MTSPDFVLIFTKLTLIFTDVIVFTREPNQQTKKETMNIELHGFLPQYAPEIQKAVWSRLIDQLPPEESNECCVTVVNSIAQKKDGGIAPFIRIYSDRRSDFQIAIDLLIPVRMPSAGLRTFVECVLLERRVEL